METMTLAVVHPTSVMNGRPRSQSLGSKLVVLSTARRQSSVVSETMSTATCGDDFKTPQEYAIMETTHALAAEAAKDVEENFHETLSSSLHHARRHLPADCVPPFSWEECELGQLLGSGEFSHVYEVKSFNIRNNHHQLFQPAASVTSENNLDGMTVEDMDQRLQMKKGEKRQNKPRYAVKYIKPEHLETHDGRMKYIHSAQDLSFEKEILSNLIHPNIIKIRGVAHSGPTGTALIIDCLMETLEDRLKRWRNQSSKMKRRKSNLLLGRSFTRSVSTLSSSFTSKVKSCVSDPSSKVKALDNRLRIAFQISAALKYLHSHSIIFRDLKPPNIGFDVRGDVKLFDFGLARFCPEDEGNPNLDAFDMSGAGSPRYMSPECLWGGRYNLKADVYAFSLVLWEILSGQTPYMFATNARQLHQFVVIDNGRPDIDRSWPQGIQSLLKSCFDVDMAKRPEMKQVYVSIREVLVALRGGERSGLEDEVVTRRRSIASIEG